MINMNNANQTNLLSKINVKSNAKPHFYIRFRKKSTMSLELMLHQNLPTWIWCHIQRYTGKNSVIQSKQTYRLNFRQADSRYFIPIGFYVRNAETENPGTSCTSSPSYRRCRNNGLLNTQGINERNPYYRKHHMELKEVNENLFRILKSSSTYGLYTTTQSCGTNPRVSNQNDSSMPKGNSNLQRNSFHFH